MFKLDLEKAEEPEIKLPIAFGSLKKQEFQKNIYCFIDYAKAFDYVYHTHKKKKLQKILRDGHSKPPKLSPEKSVCRSRSNN